MLRGNLCFLTGGDQVLDQPPATPAPRGIAITTITTEVVNQFKGSTMMYTKIMMDTVTDTATLCLITQA